MPTGGNYRNRSQIFQMNRLIAEALDDIQSQVNNVAQQTTASAQGGTNPPPNISNIAVSAANGVFQIIITDNAPVYRGINYFAEYSDTASFTQPHVLDLGASRTWRGFLGSGTFYWRAYSQYATSEPSNPVYFGSTNDPTPVAGGGVLAGPSLGSSTGSGTAPTDGKTGGSGFGKTAFRGGQHGQAPKAGFQR